MTLYEYLRQQVAYADFAATVVRIIEAGLSTRPDVARPLTSQSRAKDATSLWAKLSQRGLLDADNIETAIKDLAGCRLIFYTNSDADRFLQSRIVFDGTIQRSTMRLALNRRWKSSTVPGTTSSR
jgi:ppGpp synthetase/RelA/SpoT-type nucleotidyltranferase